MKKFLIQLSKNQKVVDIAKKIFIYFPSLKYYLIEYAYSANKSQKIQKIKYTSNFLNTIKKEIEEKKNQEK